MEVDSWNLWHGSYGEQLKIFLVAWSQWSQASPQSIVWFVQHFMSLCLVTSSTSSSLAFWSPWRLDLSFKFPLTYSNLLKIKCVHWFIIKETEPLKSKTKLLILCVHVIYFIVPCSICWNKPYPYYRSLKCKSIWNLGYHACVFWVFPNIFWLQMEHK